MTPQESCCKLLELAGKATPPPINLEHLRAVLRYGRKCEVYFEETEENKNQLCMDDDDAEFIAFSRNHAPQIAQALLIAIEALDTIESMARIETTEECHRVRVAMDKINALFRGGDE